MSKRSLGGPERGLETEGNVNTQRFAHQLQCKRTWFHAARYLSAQQPTLRSNQVRDKQMTGTPNEVSRILTNPRKSTNGPALSLSHPVMRMWLAHYFSDDHPSASGSELWWQFWIPNLRANLKRWMGYLLKTPIGDHFASKKRSAKRFAQFQSIAAGL